MLENVRLRLLRSNPQTLPIHHDVLDRLIRQYPRPELFLFQVRNAFRNNPRWDHLRADTERLVSEGWPREERMNPSDRRFLQKVIPRVTALRAVEPLVNARLVRVEGMRPRLWTTLPGLRDSGIALKVQDPLFWPFISQDVSFWKKIVSLNADSQKLRRAMERMAPNQE